MKETEEILNQANKVKLLVNRWNARASSAHDEYLGEICLIVFGQEYDCADQKNHKSDFQKLTMICKVAECKALKPEVFLEKVKKIVNL